MSLITLQDGEVLALALTQDVAALTSTCCSRHPHPPRTTAWLQMSAANRHLLTQLIMLHRVCLLLLGAQMHKDLGDLPSFPTSQCSSTLVFLSCQSIRPRFFAHFLHSYGEVLYSDLIYTESVFNFSIKRAILEQARCWLFFLFCSSKRGSLSWFNTSEV